MIEFQLSDLEGMERWHRAHLVNGLAGPKPCMLLGSKNIFGQTNVALFSQVLHVGANPPLMGVLFRPETVVRHSLQNIRQTGYFTLNHVPVHLLEEAHLSSANWAESEFEALRIGEEQTEFPAPFVKDSPVQVGLKVVKEYPIDLNDTLLVVASVQKVRVAEDALRADGFLNLYDAGSTACSGLDAYYSISPVARFEYARVGMASDKLPM